MSIKKVCLAIIFALMCLMVLVGCQMEVPQAGSVPTEQPVRETAVSLQHQGQSIDGRDIYSVGTVDEFLTAIGSNRVISLEKGVYDLNSAHSYGGTGSDCWYWQETYDGYELVIGNVKGLSILGDSFGKTELITSPRYANVVKIEDSSDVTISGITLGHSIEPGLCSGGVIYLENCEDVVLDEAYLYGCGIIGLQADNCRRVTLDSCHIYDCSYSAVQAYACSELLLTDCRIHNNGSDFFGALFQVENSRGFALVNCDIYENEAVSLLSNRYSQQTVLLGCGVRDNRFTENIFNCVGYSPVMDKCGFDSNGDVPLFFELPVLDINGDELTEAALEAMQREQAKYEGPAQPEPVELDENLNSDGMREICVGTVDEFLAAIGNDTVIKLEAELFDLSTAADYGAYGTDYYYWSDAYDGPELCISGVSNLKIVADGDCTIAAIPRYADVLSFVNCDNISLSGFTAGHTEEPGSCSGGVLAFENCWGIDIENCRLYGCGILGINAYCCSELDVRNTEIFDCSQGAVALYTVMDASFENMDIHDCMSPEISLHDCMDVYYDGELLENWMYSLQGGRLVMG